MTDSLHSRMHVVSDETRNLVNLVLEYSRRRTLAEDTPLDHPTSETELRRLAGPTVTEEGLGSARALAIFEHIFAPACISTDHPKYLSFIPSAPTKAAVAFDLVVSASALYGGSWLEGAGVVRASGVPRHGEGPVCLPAGGRARDGRGVRGSQLRDVGPVGVAELGDGARRVDDQSLILPGGRRGGRVVAAVLPVEARLHILVR